MTNNMNCNIETGICGIADDDQELEIVDFTSFNEKIDLYYVTDPICSHCWALEPVFRRFIKSYGQYFNMKTVTGGLLAGWEGFQDVKNGINGPTSVAPHWKEVGEASRMPIDGSLWYDDYVTSSYPPSRVFKVIQSKDENLAGKFLRRAREAVFAFNQNISRDDILIQLVDKIGLNGADIIKEANSEIGEALLQSDFTLAAKLGARAFPTIIMMNKENKGVKIVGARPLEYYINSLQQLLGETKQLEARTLPVLKDLLQEEGLLFAKEIEIMYDLKPNELQSFINENVHGLNYVQKEILGEVYITIR